MPQHTFSGAGVPTSTPLATGHHYTNTTNSDTYISTGTVSSADWGEPVNVGGSFVPGSRVKNVSLDGTSPEVCVLDAAHDTYIISIGLAAAPVLEVKLPDFTNDPYALPKFRLELTDATGDSSVVGSISVKDFDTTANANHNLATLLTDQVGGNTLTFEFTRYKKGTAYHWRYRALEAAFA